MLPINQTERVHTNTFIFDQKYYIFCTTMMGIHDLRKRKEWPKVIFIPNINTKDPSYSTKYEDQPLIFIFSIMQYTCIDMFADIKMKKFSNKLSQSEKSYYSYEKL
jgi:hypothetical protein